MGAQKGQLLMPTLIQSGNIEHYTCVHHFVLEEENMEFNKMQPQP